MGRQLHFALQPSSTMRKCASAPKGQLVRGYGEVYGISFSGYHDHPALERSGGLKHRWRGRAPLKYKTQSVVPAIWLVRRFFLFVRMLFVEKLGVLMTDKGGFL